MVVDVPYFGVKISNSNRYTLTIKIHGPLDSILVNTIEIKQEASKIIESLGTVPNLIQMCEEVAQVLCDKYCNGTDMLWVQVDVITTSGIMYGSSAEKVLV